MLAETMSAALLVLATLTASSGGAEASAQVDPPTQVDRGDESKSSPFSRSVDITGFVGYGIGSLKHPEYVQDYAMGLALAVDLGVTLSPHWNIGLWFSHLEMRVDPVGKDLYARKGSDYEVMEPRTGCQTCEAPALGGDTISPRLMTFAAGPRVEFMPFGLTGPYMGIGGGVSMVDVETAEVGGAVSWRGGYRYFAFEPFAVGGGVEVQGIFGDDTLGFLAMYVVDIRVRFLGRVHGPRRRTTVG